MWWTITGNFGNILPIDWSKSCARKLHMPALNLNETKVIKLTREFVDDDVVPKQMLIKVIVLFESIDASFISSFSFIITRKYCIFKINNIVFSSVLDGPFKDCSKTTPTIYF